MYSALRSSYFCVSSFSASADFSCSALAPLSSTLSTAMLLANCSITALDLAYSALSCRLVRVSTSSRFWYSSCKLMESLSDCFSFDLQSLTSRSNTYSNIRMKAFQMDCRKWAFSLHSAFISATSSLR